MSGGPGSWPRLLPVGDAAVAVELGGVLDVAVSARVRGLDRALARDPFPGFRESVPTHRSLLVVYDPQATEPAAVRAAVLARLPPAGTPAPAGALRLVPTLYGGEAGPDLRELAAGLGLQPRQLVALHAEAEYTAFMLGFTPGFAYLGPLPAALEAPRRATPRVRVPAGTVAVAGKQTAIYPSASPGGWNLIGRTSLRLFDPHADPPALIAPGDRVRFTPVDELPPAPAPAAAPSLPGGRAALEVVDAGLLTTVQDAGRFGWRRLGVGWSGPMDAPAHARANRAVGNPAGAAALECTVAGPALRFLAATAFATSGADLGAVLHRSDLGAWPVPLDRRVVARPGNVLAFAERRAGCRAYVACAGGIDVPPVLGSRSTDLVGGFGGLGGRPLAAGDRLGLGAPPAAWTDEPPRDAVAPPRGSVTVRVVLGPQADLFGAEAVASLLGEAYEIAPASDRVGCRLQGAPLRARGAHEILSDGMMPGSIQVPPDGQPIVMMADAPTTGGYAKIATVVGPDLARLAQCVPGECRVRFERIALD